MRLDEFFAAHPSGALAFSGGTDSSYLLWAALRAGADVTAYYVKTEFQPDFELADARRLAAETGARLRVLERSALAAEHVAENPPDRCYFCKRAIFGAILEAAAADGFREVFDGTNASDDAGDRPGMRALRELKVLSPLRECGLTKPEIRRLSREAGLFTWNKPAYACLATRFPAGTAITAYALRRIEEAEREMFSLGFTDFRVRLTADGCRLQLPEAQLPDALARRAELAEKLGARFGEVTLDLKTVRPSDGPDGGESRDTAAELSCNLDDMTGEDVAFAAGRLLEAGALDVWTAPITMKKGRPGVLLTCLCRAEEAERFAALMFRHTTTLGVRRTLCGRWLLARRTETENTPLGPVRVKRAEGFGASDAKPEYEDLAAIAVRENLSMAEVRAAAGFPSKSTKSGQSR